MIRTQPQQHAGLLARRLCL